GGVRDQAHPTQHRRATVPTHRRGPVSGYAAVGTQGAPRRLPAPWAGRRSGLSSGGPVQGESVLVLGRHDRHEPSAEFVPHGPGSPERKPRRAGSVSVYCGERGGSARVMTPWPERPEGVIWMEGFCTAPEEKGGEKLVAHYPRRKGLARELEHGLAVFNDEN